MLAKSNKVSKSANESANTAPHEEVEVLYQKMGDRWFAFSVLDDEVFIGSIPPETIATLEEARARREGTVGNS